MGGLACLQRSSKLLVSPRSKCYTQRCQYWSTLLLWCTRYPPSLSGKILRRLQPPPDYCCSNVINCFQLCTHNQCNTINIIKTCSGFMPMCWWQYVWFNIYHDKMPGLCEGHVTQRTVTGRGSDTEMGAAVGTCGHWLMDPVSSIYLQYRAASKCPVSVHLTMLQCKHCEQLHFHTSDAVLQFLHNPSKTGDKDIDLQSWLRNYIITTVKWWCRYLLTY